MDKERYCTCGGPVQVERDGTRICTMCHLQVQPNERFFGEETAKETDPPTEISEEDFLWVGADFAERSDGA